MKILFKICLLLLTLNSTCYANNFDVTKSKKITKEFKTAKDVTVKVDNKYGSAVFELWDNNSVEYTVEIKVGADSEKKSQELLDNIQIIFSEGGNMVQAATNFKSSSNYSKELQIKYTVKIPRNAKVDVEQKYGNILIPELYNSLNLICKYGSITIGTLHHKSNNLKLDYVTGSKIEDLNYINIEMKYSSLQVEKGNYLVIKGNYNNFKFNNIGTFNTETNYSTFKINQVQKIEINGNYLTIDLLKIGKEAVIKSNYSTIKLTPDLQTELLQTLGNYGNVYVNNLELIPFNFETKGQHTNLKPAMELDYSLKSKTNTSLEYKAIYKNNPKLKIDIKGNYTNIYLKK